MRWLRRNNALWNQRGWILHRTSPCLKVLKFLCRKLDAVVQLENQLRLYESRLSNTPLFIQKLFIWQRLFLSFSWRCIKDSKTFHIDCHLHVIIKTFRKTKVVLIFSIDLDQNVVKLLLQNFKTIGVVPVLLRNDLLMKFVCSSLLESLFQEEFVEGTLDLDLAFLVPSKRCRISW